MRGTPRPRSSPKLRRWTDLVASLLRHHYPVSFDEIAREVPGYDLAGSNIASVKRTFERDKKELLRFGVPIETRPDETGEPTLYTIRKDNFYLPYVLLAAPAGGEKSTPRHGRVDLYGYHRVQSLAFEPDELAAVADAAARVRALGDPSLAADAGSAMRKLAFDLPVDAVAPAADPRVLPPRAQPDPATFDTLGDALRDRKVVSFDYHAIGTDATARREVEPYGLFYLSGHWYLAGRDRERAALRNFRLSRMSKVARNTKAESTPDFDVPASFRLREHARSRHAWELGDGDACDAVVEFARETGATAAAARLGASVEGEPRRRCFQVRRVDAFARWLLSFAGDARPVRPEALVAEYDAQLRRTLAAYAGERAGGEVGS
ncbi:MAG: helix-turn-helix transcriptional regulator [Gemmatimonadaceae bacterium]